MVNWSATLVLISKSTLASSTLQESRVIPMFSGGSRKLGSVDNIRDWKVVGPGLYLDWPVRAFKLKVIP